MRVGICGSASYGCRPSPIKELYFRVLKSLGIIQANPMDKTGTWEYRDGKVRKISDEVPKLKVIADWQKQCNPKLDAEAFGKRYGEEW